MSIRVTLNCEVQPEKFDALLHFLEANLPNVRGFKGNMRVSVFYDQSHSEMLLDEEWLSIEDHKAYLDFIHRNGVLQRLGGFLTAPPDIKYFQPLEL